MFNWDWEDAWGTLLIVVATVLVSIGLVAIVSPHNVNYYYAGQPEQSASCIYAHKTWNTDTKVFCTNNYTEALDFMSKANAALPKEAK